MKNFAFQFYLLVLTFAMIVLSFGYAASARLQDNNVIRVEAGIAVQQDDAQDETEQESETETDDEDAGQDAESEDDEAIQSAAIIVKEPGEREIRLTLWDGTVVTGEIDIENLVVQTEFGKLEVPVRNIIQLRPGLNSFPEMSENIAGLVEKLGDRDFEVRESAHRELTNMGTSIRSILPTFEDGGSAERKKHLDKIRAHVEELVAAEEEWGEGDVDNPELIYGDTVQTGDFTIVGQILQPEFNLNSKYGQLSISLADIRSGDRTWLNTGQEITKSVAVKADAFFQTEPINSRIRVKKGDRIRIRASGNVHWASWGNINSTPDGVPNQGNWQGINCGTLVARIGNNGKYTKVGSKHEFVAEANGVLFLGVSMRDNYANQNGYQWNGEYKARIVVIPAGG